MLRHVTLLVVLTFLAGCTAQPSAQDQGTAPLQPTSEPTATNAPTAGAAGTDGAANNTTTAPVVTTTPMSYKGTTGTGACAFAVAVGNCVFPSSGTDTLKELGVKGQLLRVKANVTWSAASPATQQLTVLIAHKDGQGWSWKQGDPVAQGPSPLVADFDLSKLNGTLAFIVDSGTFESAGPAGAYASAPQDFAVEGSVLSRA